MIGNNISGFELQSYVYVSGAQTKEELTQQLKVYSESFKEEVGGFI
jgi:hypothetical protein